MPDSLISIAYAARDRQLEMTIPFLSGETILEAIQRSGILDVFPEIDLKNKDMANRVGLFSKLCQLDDEPQVGDRIEIYRPLNMDPKQARRERAKGRL